MRIAVNTRFLLPGKLEGLGIYTQELFRRIVQRLPETEFLFFFDRAYDPAFVFAENVTPVVVPPPARHPLLWYAWFEYSVPYFLKKYRADGFISPDGYASLRARVPQLLTLHDLGFEHYPEQVPAGPRWYYRHFTPKFAHKADHIVAVSDYTRRDIVSHYGVDANKITTIYNGFDPAELQVGATDVSDIQVRHGLRDRDYFIFIGAVHPRKNVTGILQAFAEFKAQSGSTHKLLLLGRDAWLNNDLRQELEQHPYKADIVWIQNIERPRLLELLRRAYALVFPSFFEGFGIPVLEAMALGVPVVTSNVSALPEVAGEAALYGDPHDVSSIARAMLRLNNEPGLADSLSEKGKIQAAKFSWDTSAGQWVELIQKTLLH